MACETSGFTHPTCETTPSGAALLENAMASEIRARRRSTEEWINLRQLCEIRLLLGSWKVSDIDYKLFKKKRTHIYI